MWREAADRELAAIGGTDAQSLIRVLVDRGGKLTGRREVSDTLGISERSLDRLLAREGVRFSELAGLQRLEKAKSPCAPERRSNGRRSSPAIPRRAASAAPFRRRPA